MVAPFRTSAFVQSATNLFTGSTLNSLASGSAIDDSAITLTNPDQWLSITLALASLNIAVATGYVGLYLLPILNDGSSYPHYTTGSSPKLPAQFWKGNLFFNLLNGAQSQSLKCWIGDLSNGAFKPLLVNQLGVAFASSGNTCTYRSFNDEY